MNFDRISEKVTALVGSPTATMLAFLMIGIWALMGPALGFSEAWQLTINTGTTIITFLMVFLIQAAQNRNDKRMHEKLDELLHAIEGADDSKADS